MQKREELEENAILNAYRSSDRSFDEVIEFLTGRKRHNQFNCTCIQCALLFETSLINSHQLHTKQVSRKADMNGIRQVKAEFMMREWAGLIADCRQVHRR